MKPRFKDPVSGFSHLVGLGLAIAGVSWLVARHFAGGRPDTALCIYGGSLIALYAASSAYHLVVAGERTTRALRALDHLAIFLLVAGTCTPVFCTAFDGAARIVMLSVVWGAAFLGVALRLTWRSAPRVVYTTLYVAMGWMLVVRWPDVLRALPTTALILIVAGGAAYTLGAVVYAIRRPNPFPRFFGFHEIWHLFVLGGSALHFAAVASLR